MGRLGGGRGSLRGCALVPWTHSEASQARKNCLGACRSGAAGWVACVGRYMGGPWLTFPLTEVSRAIKKYVYGGMGWQGRVGGACGSLHGRTLVRWTDNSFGRSVTSEKCMEEWGGQSGWRVRVVAWEDLASLDLQFLRPRSHTRSKHIFGAITEWGGQSGWRVWAVAWKDPGSLDS